MGRAKGKGKTDVELKCIEGGEMGQKGGFGAIESMFIGLNVSFYGC